MGKYIIRSIYDAGSGTADRFHIFFSNRSGGEVLILSEFPFDNIPKYVKAIEDEYNTIKQIAVNELPDAVNEFVMPMCRKTYRVGVNQPQFIDQGYLRDRDEWYPTETKKEAIEWWMKERAGWIREDEKHLVMILEERITTERELNWWEFYRKEHIKKVYKRLNRT